MIRSHRTTGIVGAVEGLPPFDFTTPSTMAYAPSSERSLPLAPPPWTCKATIYVLSFYHSASSTLPLNIVYDPLELNAETFSSEKETGKFVGGLGFAQIVRYSESPVGTYDELAILPGSFSSVEPDGKKRKDSRITGIWVSQETTLMNGRRNWNIPKCVASSGLWA